MRVLIFGASRGIGLETARQALEAGYGVRTFARSSAANLNSNSSLENFRGNALNVEDVKTALVGVDVVIQTLGVGIGELLRPVHLFSEATEILIGAMKTQKVKRLICLTGFGAGDSRASISCLQRLPFQVVFGRAYDDKSLQEQLIKDSELDWTIARPGVLTWTSDQSLQSPYRGISVSKRYNFSRKCRRFSSSTDCRSDVHPQSSSARQLSLGFLGDQRGAKISKNDRIFRWLLFLVSVRNRFLPT